MINNLNAVDFAQKDASEIERAIITLYEAVSGKKLYPGNPIRIIFQAVIAIIVQQRVLIDYSAKQNLLAYATGDFLDHIGALINCTRLPAATAVTTLRFTLSAAQPTTIIIPSGIRATAGGNIDFATVKIGHITPGNLTVDIEASCTQSGAIGNGYIVGQINQIVDPLPYVATVSNTTMSEGGADIEDDEAYRDRINIAPERFSVAGPSGAYEYWAATANQSIVDVAVDSPTPGEVVIIPLLKNGEIPDVEILDQVDKICNDKRIRPLTDHVTVVAPTKVDYDISLTYYISNKNITLALAIQEAVNCAVGDFVLWTKSKLGRDINTSELTRLVVTAGAKRVVINHPVYTVLTSRQVAIVRNIAVSYGGLEDD